MLGGLAMKWRWRARMKAAGKPADKPNIVCGRMQICWHKFARYWDVEMREVPMERGRLFMTPEDMLERVDENTIGVAATLGVTHTGNFEPVQPLSEALDRLQAEKGLDIDIHVDGASGAFLAPFCAPDLVWDFRLPRVKRISTWATSSASRRSAGWVIWRDTEDAGRSHLQGAYLAGAMRPWPSTLPAGRGDSREYYNFLRLGREGYRKVLWPAT